MKIYLIRDRAMDDLTDIELLEVLKARFEEKERAYTALKGANNQVIGLNERLLEAEQNKSMFFSEIRNEINNPLASIIAILEELFRSDASDVETFKNVLGILYREALVLEFHMKNILTASEIESGEVTPVFTRLDVNQVVDRKLAIFAQAIEEKRLTVRRQSTEPVYLNTDSGLVSMAMVNLISNAISFNNDGGEIDISVHVDADADSMVFSVKDTGIGIREKDKKRIFDRFMQIDTGLTKKYRGLGLGLSVAKAAAEMLGGEITFESLPGRGSEFTLSIPAHLSHDVEAMTMEGAEFFFDDNEEGEF